MFGHNPKRPPVAGDGQLLQVVEIFATLQGEGPYVGWPAVFLRLGGCNLACQFCDTEFEQFTELTLANIIQTIELKAQSAHGRVRQLVVITGGEPLRQPIAPLCSALLQAGFQVQIETNGTLARPLPDAVEIICSPKAESGAYGQLHPELLQRLTALKFLISAESGPYNQVPELGQNQYNLPVYVQAIDTQNPEQTAANTAHALALAQEYGYRLSLQTHKILRIA